MKLSEIKFSNLKIGQKVRSVYTGSTGTVAEKVDGKDTFEYGHEWARIQWDNGSDSMEPLPIYTGVELVEG